MYPFPFIGKLSNPMFWLLLKHQIFFRTFSEHDKAIPSLAFALFSRIEAVRFLAIFGPPRDDASETMHYNPKSFTLSEFTITSLALIVKSCS